MELYAFIISLSAALLSSFNDYMVIRLLYQIEVIPDYEICCAVASGTFAGIMFVTGSFMAFKQKDGARTFLAFGVILYLARIYWAGITGNWTILAANLLMLLCVHLEIRKRERSK